MIYTVVWVPAAQDELANLWVAAADQAEVAAASDLIDATLRQNPDLFSESRSGNRRVMFVPPLAVKYEVSNPDRLVQVLNVWRYS